MNKIILALLLILASPRHSWAQKDTCNCPENFDKLVAKTEENYAGYPDKVTPATEAGYNRLVRSVREKTRGVTDPKACFFLLREYIRFFKDKHFILSYDNEKATDHEMIPLTEKSFKAELLKRKRAGIEGIWVNPDSSLKLAIRQVDAHTFKAIVLASRNPGVPAGLVYCTLTRTRNGFLANEYDFFITTDIPARQRGNLFQIWNRKLFGRVFPGEMTREEKAELATWRDNNGGLAGKKLSAKTAYLKVPSFLNNDDRIGQLVQQHDSLIRSCENLIVDLRSNGGGNTGWVSFLPYFMTNPVVQHPSYLRVTPENVAAKLKDLEPFVVNPIPQEYKKYFPDEVLQAYKKAWQELPATNERFYPVPGVTFPLDSLLPKPARIALLVDDLCGSSTEYFFYLSRQSKKTTTYGINTIGMMDYEGMSNPTPLPYGPYILTIPIVKSSWTDKNPIDRTGFRPDVLLDKIEPRKWIEFVQARLEKN